MKLNFSNISVLVIGDFMLDKYTIGTSNRMSPEFPVPVILKEEEIDCPGGAGNVVLNLLSLGAHVSCMGFIGNDKEGVVLSEILKSKGANIDFLRPLDGHTTTLKNRIISNNIQQVRIDSERKIKVPSKIFFKLLSNDTLNKFDVIILSDYNKGIIDKPLFDYKKHNVIVDPKKTDFSIYANANIVTPNIYELQATSKVKLKTKKLIVKHCNELILKYNINHIVVKRGAKGMIVVSENNNYFDICAHNVSEPDVTGAGDTVISVLSLMMNFANDIKMAAEVANLAASIVVSKKGTSTISLKEISKGID